MDGHEIKKRIDAARNFSKPVVDADSVKTDQEMKLPQPSLFKAPAGGATILLPTTFDSLSIDNDFLHIINSRESRRIYTFDSISLIQLSYLLWCAQGVKRIRGKSYAALRTVPSGGGRHPFEVYMTVRHVEGLSDGYYHYLPEHHSLECLEEEPDLDDFISVSLSGQKWAAKANVVFYFSFVCYRAEWRYSFFAHRVAMIDAGHITQNLYLAATSVGLGGCAVAAVDMEAADRAFGLDGKEEFIFYAMPVGTISSRDKEGEEDFYRFVKEEGL